MDPNNPTHQPNQNGQDPPVSSGQAADLIRQQLANIYGNQPATTQPDPADAQKNFNPYQSIESDPAPPATIPPSPNPVTSQNQQNIPAPQPQTMPYSNPYNQANPVVDANQVSSAPNQTRDPEGNSPGSASYRNNYATFTIPGSEPQAAPHTPQVTETAPHVDAQRHLSPQIPQNEAVSEDLEPKPTMADLKNSVVEKVRKQSSKSKASRSKWKPLIVSLAVGLIFLSINYNEVVVAQVKQYISPGDSISTPVILDPTLTDDVGSESKIIIPKINVDVPVIYDITGYDEKQIQDGLERGVVHYGNTALPGQKGNNVIVGHSSNNYFNSGEYKFAFVLLFRLEIDDTFILHYKGQRYIYKVFNKQVIEADDFSLIQPSDKPITTLITCTPPGTSWRRLVIQAEQITPDPSEATTTTSEIPTQIDTPVPGNAQSLWQRITDSIF